MSKTITPEIIHGLFVGTLKGICAWDIPQQLKEKLERQIKELEGMETEKQKPKLKSTLKFSHSGQIFDIVITSDHTDEKTFNHVVREMLFSKDMWLYVLSYNPRDTDKQIEEEGEPLYPHTLKEPLFDADKYIDADSWQIFGQKAFEYANKLKAEEFGKIAVEVFGYNEDIFDTTSMD